MERGGHSPLNLNSVLRGLGVVTVAAQDTRLAAAVNGGDNFSIGQVLPQKLIT